MDTTKQYCSVLLPTLVVAALFMILPNVLTLAAESQNTAVANDIVTAL